MKIPTTVIVVIALVLASFPLDYPLYCLVKARHNPQTQPGSVNQSTLVSYFGMLLESSRPWGEQFFILLAGVAIWRIDPTRRSRVLRLVIAAICVMLAVEGIKRITGRDRPFVAEGKTTFHGLAYWNNWKQDHLSFPSGHTASAFCHTAVISEFYPPLRPVLLTLAVGTGLNRIWNEKHFLSDCVVGALFGYWFGGWFAGRVSPGSIFDRFDRLFTSPTTVDSTEQIDHADSAPRTT
jgi:membrane-associated phospholipid phosphatase